MGAPISGIVGLGHVGVYVWDLELMTAFYRDTLGMTLSKQDPDLGLVFFSADPDAVDHEIALVRGRPAGDQSHQIHQISLQVATLDDVRRFSHRLPAAGCTIDVVLNHGSAIGCYFFDPEGNRTEVFWLTGESCWKPEVEVVDIELPNDRIVAAAHRVAVRNAAVPIGGPARTAL